MVGRCRDRGLGVVAIALVALFGCDRGAASRDASIGDAGSPDPLARDAGTLPPLVLEPPAPPAAPEPPRPPALTPCAGGFVEEDGVCRPALDGAPACAAGEHAFAEGCRRVGRACPEEPWPEELPADRTLVFVSPDGREDAAGTRDDPLRDAGAAAIRARPDGVVVLSAGTHRSSQVVLSRSVALRGACAEATRLVSALPGADRVLVAMEGESALADVTVASSGVPVVVAGVPGTDARIAGVVVEGGLGAGVLVSARARAELDDVVVRGIEPLAAWGNMSWGMGVMDGSAMLARRVLVEDIAGAGVVSLDSGQLEAVGLTVRRVRAHAHSPDADCILVLGAALASIDGGLVEHCESAGAFADGAGARLALDRVLVRDVIGRGDGTLGEGIRAGDGSDVAIRRSIVERTRTAGVGVGRAALEVVDTLVSDTLPARAGGASGFGVLLGPGASATLERVRIERPRVAGVASVWGAPARLTARDVSVRSPRRAPASHAGAGLSCVGGATCALERVEVLDAEGVGVDLSGEVTGTDLAIRGVRVAARGGSGSGLFVGGAGVARLSRVWVERASAEALKVWGGGHAVLTDVTLRETEPDRYLFGGMGAWVTEGGRLELARALVEDMRYAAIVVDGAHPEDPSHASSLEATDLLVRRVHGDSLVQLFGNALRAMHGTTSRLVRARLVETREAAIVALNPGTRVEGRDVEIAGTRMRACTEREVDRCGSDVGGGCGVTAFDEANVALERFRSADNALCGVMVAPRSTITLRDGEIANNPIGANVQAPEYDLRLLSELVRYVGNVRNYDGARLPVPDDAPPSL